MNRRVLLAAVVAALLGGGLAAPALAEGVPQPERQKVCVKQATLVPNGYCIVLGNLQP